LNEKLLPVTLPEEQYHIQNLYRLWETILDRIAEQDKYLEAELELKSFERNSDENMLEALLSYLRDRNKQAIVFLENFSDILSRLEKKRNKSFARYS